MIRATLVALFLAQLTGCATLPADCAMLWKLYELTGDSRQVDAESCYAEDYYGRAAP